MYKKTQTLKQQIESMSQNYMRHGGKQGRRKQVERLVTAVVEAGIKYDSRSLHQFGNKHVLWHDEQLRRLGRSIKTRESYWLAWKKLWEWLGRNSLPPKPKSNDR